MSRFNRLLILACLAAGGCAAGTTAKPPSAAASLPPPPPQGTASARADLSIVTPTGPAVVRMDVYQLTVPFGAVSRSDEFWKRVDEGAIEVATYDLLLKNGVRIGIGDNKEWPYFKGLIDDYHATIVEGSSNPMQVGALELPLKSKVDYQDLFWFNDRDILFGRTFEHSDNVLVLQFLPHPRKEEHAVVKVCPLVRGLRKKLEFTVRNDEREIEMVTPEQMLDMAAEADIPPDHFLIMAPSTLAKWSTSVGQAFFAKDGTAERLETILILLPHSYRLGEGSR